ncbi:protein FAM214A isoform X1 [Electrophorus electricus]|uniref:Atos homolog protein A n=1 Tax=Electrophorus electricus TaxID=8005 RepID=A0AAY5EG91_ELEEL|nr:protein FAM214A isoform X1 [Electrophorus electricus]
MFKEKHLKPKQASEEGRRMNGSLEGITAAVANMKSDREAVEEFFEYDAEEFLVSLTLLITEGRTPECSVKGRTEGLHCPPAQTGTPVISKHECNDKLPQCRQARRTRSEVMLLWRNHIPIMIEVMLLPDCCYSDEGLATDGTDLNDPAIKQDALLLERWTLQPVPRQSGDRFIEEKTLLLAVRSYVFFSQLSAWLSASHGIVPRNILYRISAADEGLIWNFSQTPSEHAFPVPNVSHSVALKVRVQSLPRQPNYPVLKCSIHSGLAFLGKHALSPTEGALRRAQPVGEAPKPLRLQGSPLLCHRLRSMPPPSCSSSFNPHKCPPRPESPLLPGKAVKWLYSRANGGVGVPPSDTNGTESLGKAAGRDSSPARRFKTLSLADSVSPGQSPRPSSGETNPLIGSLLQERQEVIARIAQRLNFCDPTAPHLPDALFTSPCEPPVPKTPWSSARDEGLYMKTKDPPTSCSPQAHDRTRPESPASLERSQTSLFHTPLSPRSQSRSEQVDPAESRTSPKPASCRRLQLGHPGEVQDISRLIQERLQQSHEFLNSPYKLCPEPLSQRASCQNQNHRLSPSPTNGHVSPSRRDCVSDVANGVSSTDPLVHVEERGRGSSPETQHRSRPVTVARSKPTEPGMAAAPVLDQHSHRHTHSAKAEPWGSLGWPEGPRCLNGVEAPQTREKPQGRRAERQAQDENKEPWSGLCTTPTSLPQWSPKPDSALNSSAGTPLRSATSPLKPCSNWKKQNRHSIDETTTRAFHPCTGLPLLSSPVPQRRSQTGYFDLDASLIRCKGVPWAASKRVCLKKSEDTDEPQQLLSASAPPASLSLLGNFEECVLNYRLEPLGTVEGFTAEVGASGTFCPSHMTFPVDVSFYSVSDDNAPSPYMGVINLESLGKRGYRVPPSGTIQVTLFNPNKTVVKMFVVMYDLREMPAGHQTFLRQRTFSVPVKREFNGNNNKKPLPLLGQGRTLRYLIHLRFQSSKSGKIYLHRDIRLLFSRKSMEVDSGAAYELKSFTESPADPPFSPRC